MPLVDLRSSARCLSSVGEPIAAIVARGQRGRLFPPLESFARARSPGASGTIRQLPPSSRDSTLGHEARSVMLSVRCFADTPGRDMVGLKLTETLIAIRTPAASSDDEVQAAKAKEVLRKLACVLARQAAREDNALEEAKEGTPSCASPSTPDSARTSRTPDP